jgi:hypothetical protein
MAVHVRDHHPHTVTVEGGTVRLKLARMTPPQFEAFNAMYHAMAKGRGNPAMKSIPEDETPEAAAARTAAHIAYLKENARWIVETFHEYVCVVDGDLVLEANGEVVTDGARFVELYAAEATDVLAELWMRNGLTDSQKKTLLSLYGSGTGSITASSQAAAGTKHATTATSAAPRDSAPPAGAMAPSSAGSSGTTGRSSSKRARSSRSRRPSTTSSACSVGATRAGSPPWCPPVGSAPRGRKARG